VRSFIHAFRKISNIGASVGSYFLVGIMILVVASILIRPLGKAIPGSYELIELLIVVTVAFAFAYTMVKQGHISVSFLVSRFKARTQSIIASFIWLLSLGIWGVITWANANLMLDKWSRERSLFLEVPFLPFRFIWVFGLLLFCVAMAIEVYNAVKGAVKP
jgi:TRAP-type C4-dicarboxylate transport system permease small subunit